MTTSNKPSTIYWIIAIIALLWNGFGVKSYLDTAFKTESIWSELSAEQVAFMDSIPAWMTALFAIAVFSGLIGSICLLARKKWAVPLLVLSFITATVQQLYWLFGTEAQDVFGERYPYLMPTLVIVFGALFVWYARKANGQGYLK